MLFPVNENLFSEEEHTIAGSDQTDVNLYLKLSRPAKVIGIATTDSSTSTSTIFSVDFGRMDSEQKFSLESNSVSDRLTTIPEEYLQELGIEITLRINEDALQRLLARFNNQVHCEKMEYVLRSAFNKVTEQFADLVTEIRATKDFIEGETTQQYKLLVLINRKEYSIVEIILNLADGIFGPLFLETGILFGLTVMSESEWHELCSSKEFEVSDALTETVILLTKDTTISDLSTALRKIETSVLNPHLSGDIPEELALAA